MPALARDFLSAHPGVVVQIRTALIAALLEDLERGDLDVVLGPLDGVAARDLEATVLADEHLVLITPETDPSATLGALTDSPFVCLPSGSGLRALLEAAFQAHGFHPRVDLEVSDPREIPPYVAAGLGAAVLARSIADKAGLASTPLDTSTSHPPLGLVHSRRTASVARAFIQHIGAQQ